MNEIALVAPEEITKRIDAIRKLPMGLPISTLEDARADTNSYIKSVKDEIKRAKEEYLKPFSEIEKRALEVLKPLEDENARFSKELLERKKADFEAKVKAEWEYLSSLDPDGNVAPFAEVYDPDWYGTPEKVWKPLLASRIKAYVTKGERTTAYFVLEGCTKEEASEVEGFLISRKIAYRKETL